MANEAYSQDQFLLSSVVRCGRLLSAGGDARTSS
jgi:hypothetical protein